APATVRRRLANWSTLTRWRGLEGAFTSPAVKSAIRLAVRALNRPKARKSANAITGDILGKLLATCSGEDLTALRDRAILMVAFASGGRRRSEMAGLRTEQLVKQAPVTDEDGSPLPSLGIHLGRTKTSGADHDEIVYLTGRPVDALTRWLEAARIDKGSVFRKIDRWGNVSTRALEPSAVNAIVKRR
ncbi:integrase, partial [Falsochrobactrum shanghaiense]